MDAPPRRPLANWRVIGASAIVVLVIGAVMVWKDATTIAPPFKPPDISMQHYRERLGGLASVSDNYLLLLSKADAYNKPELLNYLRSLDHLNPGERLEVGQALDHGPIMVSQGSAGFAQIHVPGDLKLDTLNWDSTQTQIAALAGNNQHVEITPEVLKALAQRKQKLIDLGVSPPPPSAARNFQQDLAAVMSDRDFGQAFICTPTPLYKFSLSTAPPGGPSWMNKKPELIAQAGTRVYKEAVFGNSGVIRNETRIKLVRSLSAPSYFVKSDELKDGCP